MFEDALERTRDHSNPAQAPWREAAKRRRNLVSIAAQRFGASSMSKQRGFSFPEFVVVVALVVALAGVITPYVARDMSAEKNNTARTEVNRIASAVLQYMNDTQYPPTGDQGKPSFHWLAGPGHPPSNNAFNSGDSAALDEFFVKNTWAMAAWRGPYLDNPSEDPWGCHYIVNVDGFSNHAERVFVLSAGPNRTVETKPSDNEARGDDVAVVLR
jgi:type II secretory pathway pseudopilin PulG